MRKKWLSKADDTRNEKSYERKMHDAFMAHLGKRYEEQLFEEDARNMDIHAPKSLDDWFLQFCKEKWGKESVALKRNREGEVKNMKIVDQESTKEIAVGQKRENDEKYFTLLMYAEQMRVKLKRQQERQRKMKKVAIFVAFFLGAAILATGTTKALGINPWKLFIKDEGTNVIISQSEFGEERKYYLSSDWSGYYYPSYIPEGYELVEEIVDKFRGKLSFENGTDELCFYCVYHDSVTALDKERVGYELIQIEDQMGYLVVNEKQSTACLYLDKCTVSIFYNSIKTDDVYKIMKKIKIFS